MNPLLSLRRGFGGVLVAVLVLAWPGGAGAEDWLKFDFSLRFSNRFNVKRNQLNTEGSLTASGGGYQSGPGRVVYESPFNLRLNKNELGYSGFLGLGADLHMGKSLSMHVTADTGEVKFKPLVSYEPKPDCKNQSDDPRCGVTANGRDILDEAEATGFVRELYLEAGFGLDDWLQFRAGKMLVSTGNGFIMDNYALGASASADLDLGFEVPLKLTLHGLLPNGDFSSEGKASPYVFVEIAYLMTFFEEIGLFFAWYHDGDDILGDMLFNLMLDIIPEAASLASIHIRTRGNLFWVGARANWIFDRASLSGTAIVEFGGFDASVDATPLVGGTIHVEGTPRSLGGMLDVSFHYDVTDDITLGTFLLYMSGESETDARTILDSRFNSYISVYPYVTRTNLFFSGGMNESYSARSFSTSGVNLRGVIAPGLSAGFDLTEDITVRLVSALLFSQGPHPQSNSMFYGWENDLNFRWNASRHVSILLEADYLWTGGFFDFAKPLEAAPADRAYTREPDTWKILVGVDLFY